MPAYDDLRYNPLVAFDGTVSESAAVEAVVTFLKRRYRGRYLLIEADVGVIGRDILNHTRILLDGPKLTWVEPAP